MEEVLVVLVEQWTADGCWSEWQALGELKQSLKLAPLSQSCNMYLPLVTLGSLEHLSSCVKHDPQLTRTHPIS